MTKSRPSQDQGQAAGAMPVTTERGNRTSTVEIPAGDEGITGTQAVEGIDQLHTETGSARGAGEQAPVEEGSVQSDVDACVL